MCNKKINSLSHSFILTWRALVAVDGVELVGVVEERARVAAELRLPAGLQRMLQLLGWHSRLHL